MRSKMAGVVALIFSVFQTFATDILWRNPSHGPFHWWEISVTSNAFYLPAPGAFLRSTNAHDWTLYYPNQTPVFYSIAQSPDKWIAVASHSDVGGQCFFVSTDGIDFKFLTDFPYQLYKIVYGQGRFVAAGLDLFWSDNGVDWTRVSDVPATDSVFNGDLIFANGLFLRASRSGIYVSSDGKNWKGKGPGARRLSYYNGLYAAAGDGVMSFSTQIVPSISPISMAIGSKGAVAASDSLSKPAATALFSADTTNWIIFTLPFSNRPWDIKFINDEYVMVGDGGLIAYSSDGTNWINNSSLNTAVHPWATVRSEDRIVAVGGDNEGGGAAVWSSDDLMWHNAEVPAAKTLFAVAYQNGTFVAVGDEGNVIVSTNNGSNWFAPARVTTGVLSDITASPRGFAAVGRTNIFSADGINWETLPNPGLNFSYIAYGNGVYIAIGAGNYDELGAALSRDLVHWDLLPIRAGGPIRFGNGRFVLPGYSSTDGTNWVHSSFPGPHNVTFSEGVFTGIGTVPPNDVGYVSIDGLSWHPVFQIPQIQSHMGHYLGRFFLFNPAGGVAEIDNFGVLNLGPNPDGTFNLTPIHPARFTSETETSSDLLSWQSATNLSSLTIPPDGQRFFRLKLK